MANGVAIRLCDAGGNEIASATTGAVTFPGLLDATVDWTSTSQIDSENFLLKLTPSPKLNFFYRFVTYKIGRKITNQADSIDKNYNLHEQTV